MGTFVRPSIGTFGYHVVTNSHLLQPQNGSHCFTIQPPNSGQGLRFVVRSFRTTGLIGLLLAVVTVQGFAVRRAQYRHYHHRRHVRHIVWNPMFRGSHEMLVRQNLELDKLELVRISDDEELIGLEEKEALVPLTESKSVRIASNLTENRRYCKPWTRDFVQDFGQAFYEQFHKPIQVNSAVRTADQQKKLRRHNRNAGPVEGETASTHLTGVSVDISKRGLTRKEHQWIEQYFLPLKNEGLVDPIEERRQPVFHVVVFDRYTEWRESQQVANTETDVN
jgi:hypothetical protein